MEETLLFTFGKGDQGQLGLGNTLDSFVPKEVVSMRKIVLRSILGGYYHSLALDAQGNVWTWGCGGEGQCGQGNDENQVEPAIVSLRGPALRVFTGPFCSYASLAGEKEGSGELWGWGRMVHRETTTPMLVKSFSDRVTIDVRKKKTHTFFPLSLSLFLFLSLLFAISIWWF
jgi:alpha-tubulin suppressor-like RCC1 family protein